MGFFVTLALCLTVSAQAGGPRWYTGAPFYTAPAGQPVAFFTPSPLYFTDPGDLAANVNHAQADAMVAAAAATWNVPTSNLTLALGGTLSEHVSSDNTYFDGTNVVFPDDVKLTNYHAKPIAIIYDTDGSVIDTLLGSGASSPSGCRQNGVVEDVDGLDPAGTIDHAILILNGRCVGTGSDQLMQMQYQLMREFGRIIGLAWSQLNDNVFTGVPQPTAAQVANWPVMHPIDVLCGPFTYKCMAQPFVLRADDLSALAQLYPVTSANITPGKTVSNDGAILVTGTVTFPTGEGMDNVNIVVRRKIPNSDADTYEIASGVTGAMHTAYSGNPVSGVPAGVGQSSGMTNNDREGLYFIQRVPIVGPVGVESIFATTEAINRLYTGNYAVAPYIGAPATASGAPVTMYNELVHPGDAIRLDATIQDASASCNTGSDGEESAPVASDPSGLWTGLICADMHTAWLSETVKAGHTWTVETTAVDEQGIGSNAKAHLLLGLWKSSDPTGALPTVSASSSSLNAMVIGMTQLHVDAASAVQSYRIAIADERGHGRPDFVYKARILYADSIAPVQVGASGGSITVTGTGFHNGNVVTVNGVAASVISWTPTQIVATAPSRAAANMTAAGSADVTVRDATTGGTTTIQAALSYGGTQVDSMVLVGAPAQVQTGVTSSTAFSVRVLSPDGVTPAPGASVQLTATGAATLTACGAATCNLTTDANGLAQSTITASAAGSITLTATEQSSGSSVQATVSAVSPVRTVTSANAPRYLAAGTPASWQVGVTASQDGTPATGESISWTAAVGLNLSSPSSSTDAAGVASVVVSTGGLAAGTQAAIQGCGWSTVCASTTFFGIGPSEWMVSVASGAGQSVNASAVLAPVVLRVTDQAGHPLQGATVTVHQTVDAWEGVCAPTGRCAAAPVLASSQTTLTSDPNGLVNVTPMNMPGIASVVNIAVVTGTQGFISMSLTKTP